MNVVPGYPDCVTDEIKEFRKSSPCESGRDVSSYNFQEQIVFVFSPGNCGADLSAAVYDSQCNVLGYLGGFIGNTIINEEDFSKAEFIETIWSD